MTCHHRFCRVLRLFSSKLEFMWPVTTATERLIVLNTCFQFVKYKKHMFG